MHRRLDRLPTGRLQVVGRGQVRVQLAASSCRKAQEQRRKLENGGPMMEARAKTAAVRKVQCGRRPLGFTQVLQVLDGRLRKLDHQPEERKRLQEAVEVLALMLELVEQLQVRCLEVRGFLGLRVRVE